LGILAGYSPFLEPLSLDEAYMDMTGFEEIYGSHLELAKQIKKQVHQELGIIVSIGIASGKEAAKVASDIAKPNGLVEIPTGGDANFLAPLPVSKLPGVGAKTDAKLKQMGIRYVGELATTPSIILRQRFGVYGDRLHQWANGQDHSRVSHDSPVKSISRETTFPQDLLDGPSLRGTLRYLTERVGAQLRREGKETRCVTLRLRYYDFTTISRNHTLAHATQDNDVIFQSALTSLNRAFKQRRDRVRLIGVGVGELINEAQQLPLMIHGQEHGRKLCVALDDIRDRYGFHSIQKGSTFILEKTLPPSERQPILRDPA
jgi:DNA polymerase-4